jgi:hypothetical protein
VSYRFWFEGKALVQIHRIPSAALDAIVRRVADLVDAPWDADLMDTGGDPTYRQALFGNGLGILTFRTDDTAETIAIFDITWAG